MELIIVRNPSGNWEVKPLDFTDRAGAFVMLSFDAIENQMLERGALQPGEKIDLIEVESYGLRMRVVSAK